ncbi:MAG: T9SS type A sorting domain-containing protein [Saprospiraceae bacterium]|nr:T9SS type A sorting domain-containing protein [Saprospiraceae bacterium]MDW8484142.1 T9SS type A sorting domain-containing protein [Saprospiraceae bacterium]
MKHVLPLLLFVTWFTASAVSQNIGRGDVSVYPNPVVEYLAINDPSESVGFVLVFNLVGKKVREFEYTRGATLPVGDLPKGMYLVQMLDRQRNILKTQVVDKR